LELAGAVAKLGHLGIWIMVAQAASPARGETGETRLASMRRDRERRQLERERELFGWVFVFSVIGFEITALTVSILGIDSRLMTVPFRAVVLGLSLLLLGSWLLNPRGRFISFLLVFYLAAYAVRLLYDWLLLGYPEAQEALVFFLGVAAIPAVALSLTWQPDTGDIPLAKRLLVAGSIFLGLVFLGTARGVVVEGWADQGRLGFAALNPSSVGYASAVVCTAGTYLAFSKGATGILWRVIGAAVGVLALSTLLSSGSRGPMIGMILALSWYALSNFQRASFATIAVLVFSFLVPVMLQVLDTGLTGRIMAWMEGGWQTDLSSLDRIELQSRAIQDFLDAPVFGKHFADPAFGFAYPHNVYIETAMALGVVGLAPLIAVTVLALLRIHQYFGAAHPLLVMIFIIHFMAAQVAGAMFAAMMLYIIIGVVLANHKMRSVERLERLAGRTMTPLARR
jgi:hypothetical protein